MFQWSTCTHFREALLEPITQQRADRYDASTHPDAAVERATATQPDRTHLNELGKQVFGDMVAHAASQNVPALSPYISFAPSESSARE